MDELFSAFCSDGVVACDIAERAALEVFWDVVCAAVALQVVTLPVCVADTFMRAKERLVEALTDTDELFSAFCSDGVVPCDMAERAALADAFSALLVVACCPVKDVLLYAVRVGWRGVVELCPDKLCEVRLEGDTACSVKFACCPFERLTVSFRVADVPLFALSSEGVPASDRPERALDDNSCDEVTPTVAEDAMGMSLCDDVEAPLPCVADGPTERVVLLLKPDVSFELDKKKGEFTPLGEAVERLSV
jgi:hypothetical protein